MAFLLILINGSVKAQNAANPANGPKPATEKPADGAAPKSGLEGIADKIRFLPNDKGELIPVPQDASLEGYLEYLRRHRDVPAANAPTVAVTSIDLSGEVLGDIVTLHARVTVEVIGGNSSPVNFTLGCVEAVIQQVRVRSSGKATFGGKDADRGYVWWLDGAGAYEFDLTISVPVRKATHLRRLQLSLPSSPVTSLRLQLPLAEPRIKFVSDDVVTETLTRDDGRTEVHASGFGSRLDFSWQPVPTTGNQTASLDAITTILVRGAADGLYLDATQVVRALQGVFRDVDVQLPEQSELLQVDGAEIVESSVDPEDPTLVTVRLNGPTSGPVTFRWRVRIPHTERKRMVLSGFSIDAAKRQSGSVGLVEVEDARWSVVEAGEPHLERITAGEFRASTSGVPVVRAYRFYQQPFRLPLALESIAAYYDVQPTLAVYAAEEEIRLEGRFQVRTFRGKLSQLSLLWPGWRTEGWVLEGIEPRGSVVAGFATNEADLSEGRIQVNLSDQAPENFELRFSARRSRKSGEETRLTLPLLERPSTSGGFGDTQVVLFAAVNVDAELNPRKETVLRRVLTDDAPDSDSFGLEQGLRSQSYRLQTEERQFSLRITPQPPRVRVNTATKAHWTGRRLEIRQTINHHVDYSRLGDLALVVPLEIAERVTFRFGSTELVPEWTEGHTAKERIAWLTLPSGRHSAVAIELNWNLSIPETWVGDRSLALTIPLARSDFASSTQSSVEISRPAWFDLVANDPRWLVQHEDDERIRWHTAADVKDFPLVVNSAKRTANLQFQITRAVIRAAIDREGGQACRFQVRLSGQGPDLSLHLPGKSSPPDVWWDAVPLSRQNLIELPAGSRHYSLRLPEDDDSVAEHVLTVDYMLPTGKPLGNTAAVVSLAPELPLCEWSAQVIWQVHLPPEQHLWVPPDAAAPLFHWRRDGWYWRRASTSSDEEVQTWLQGDIPAAPPELRTPQGHVYAFRQLGAAQQLRFHTLSAPLALLCGAGMSIAIGFLALQFRQVRSLIVVMCGLCALAVAALWFLPEMELLFQPMVLGAAFPTLIAAVDIWYRRRALASAWTLSTSVSDYRTASGDVPPTQSLSPVHADSATVFRVPSAGEPNPARVPAESHAG